MSKPVVLSEFLGELSKLDPEQKINVAFKRSWKKVQFVDKNNFVVCNVSAGLQADHTWIELQSLPQQEQQTVASLMKKLKDGNPDAIVAVCADAWSSAVPITLPVVPACPIFAAPGLFIQTTLNPELAEASLVESLRAAQVLDWTSAQTWASAVTTCFPPDTHAWLVGASWYTTAQLWAKYPGLISIQGWKRMFAPASPSLQFLQNWNLDITVEAALTVLGAATVEAVSEKPKETIKEPPADVLRKKYTAAADSVQQPASPLPGDSSSSTKVGKPAAPLGTCLRDFVASLEKKRQLLGDSKTNVSIAAGFRFWNSRCSSSRLQTDTECPSERGNWNAIVLLPAEPEARKQCTLSELVSALFPYVLEKPWAIACILVSPANPCRLAQIGDVVLTVVGSDKNIASLDMNPYHQGGSLFETCTKSGMQPKVFASLYPDVQCYIVDGVYYSVAQFNASVSMSSSDVRKLLPYPECLPVLEHGIQGISLKGLSMQELIQNFPVLPCKTETNKFEMFLAQHSLVAAKQ